MDLEEIFRVHQKEVYVYLLRVTGDAHLAEDLAQETFLRAFRGALTFRGESSVRTWLFSIARRVLARHFERTHQEELGVDDDRIVDTDPALQLEISEALAVLPVGPREALVLCDVLGFTPTEAADVLETTPNAFRVRLHRARSLFRKVYAHD